MPLLSRLLFSEKKPTLFPNVRSGLSIVSIPRAPDCKFFYSFMCQAQESLEGCRQFTMTACNPDVKHHFLWKFSQRGIKLSEI